MPTITSYLCFESVPQFRNSAIVKTATRRASPLFSTKAASHHVQPSIPQNQNIEGLVKTLLQTWLLCGYQKLNSARYTNLGIAQWILKRIEWKELDLILPRGLSEGKHNACFKELLFAALAILYPLRPAIRKLFRNSIQ
jgi:hypothetical protein